MIRTLVFLLLLFVGATFAPAQERKATLELEDGRVLVGRLVQIDGTAITIDVDGKDQKATLYDRSKTKSGNVIRGPAIVLQMDTTTLILPGHIGTVDDFGNIMITPEA